MSFKEDFPLLRESGIHYLDSAATTQKPDIVLNTLLKFYRSEYSNVHRGIYPLSERATELYEGAREYIAEFINASPDEVVFLRNTTEALNLVAYTLFKYKIKKGDRILVSIMEHHSNFVPWQQLAKDRGAIFRVIPLVDGYRLDLEVLERELKEGAKVVAITHLSNVLGVTPPIKDIATMAHNYGALVVVDGAQSVPHMKVDVKELDADFFAFSGHKIYGPTGVGVLYGKREILDKLPLFLYGGEMINRVEIDETSFREPPHKFEAGTPPIAEAVALKSAIEYVTKIGYERIENEEKKLVEYAYEVLDEIDEVEIYGPPKDERRGVIAFNVKGVHPHDIAGFLGEEGVYLRAGHHCAEPLHSYLGVPYSLRVSFAIYNDEEDIVALKKSLIKAIEVYRR